MTDVIDLSDRLWRGQASIEEHHPFAPRGDLTEVADGCAFVSSFANVTAFGTSDVLVLVDTGSLLFARAVHEQLRTWSPAPVHTAVYSHGHIDHVFGVPLYDEEARANGWERPRVL